MSSHRPKPRVREQRQITLTGTFDRSTQQAGGVLADFLGGPNRMLAAAFEVVREPKKMHVVRIVTAGIHADRLREAGVILIGPRCTFVHDHGIMIATHAHVDVRGHVNEVPRSGREFADAIRARDSLLRIRAGLDEVNIQVIGSGMRLDAFENGLDGR
jgi:hypothetical protein